MNEQEILQVAASHVTALRHAMSDLLNSVDELRSRDLMRHPQHDFWRAGGPADVARKHAIQVLRPAWPPTDSPTTTPEPK